MEKFKNYVIAIGLEIKKIRENINFSKSNMAEALNVSESYIYHLEYTYNSKISLSRYYLMSTILKVKLSNILKRVDNKILNDKHISITDDGYLRDYKDNINPDFFVSYVCNEIKEERTSKGISQNVIAKKIDITRRYYGDIESGKNKSISIYRLLEITEVIETPLYILVERAEDKIENNSKI
ncbi:helix-turn-helix domain-containing protein [Staphylococcus xylosus]|uniref:helix-turn-helix domain-containing protein n=1 Tax=Staphylococcus xylosus TaxID=1288 RepID=UPI003690A8C2